MTECVCLYNGVVVIKAQCKPLETESFGLCQRRSPVMWMETNLNMVLSVTMIWRMAQVECFKGHMLYLVCF